MTMSKDITRILLVGIGVTSLASLVYFAGPLIAIGGYQPLESYIVREIAIVLLVAARPRSAALSSTAARRARTRSPQG